MMSKPAPYRLQIETYPYRILVQTRYADLDVNRHLNNVAIATLFEEGRVRFLTGQHNAGLSTFGAVVVAANFTYMREGIYGLDVEMGCGIAKLGNTSWTIHAAAFQNGIAFATCESTGVHFLKGAAAQISDAWRAQLSNYLIKSPD